MQAKDSTIFLSYYEGKIKKHVLLSCCTLRGLICHLHTWKDHLYGSTINSTFVKSKKFCKKVKWFGISFAWWKIFHSFTRREISYNSTVYLCFCPIGYDQFRHFRMDTLQNDNFLYSIVNKMVVFVIFCHFFRETFQHAGGLCAWKRYGLMI